VIGPFSSIHAYSGLVAGWRLLVAGGFWWLSVAGGCIWQKSANALDNINKDANYNYNYNFVTFVSLRSTEYRVPNGLPFV
jgi:hypothetical protein